MTAKKTLAQRQKELQVLLATPEGRRELQEMERRYQAAGGPLRLGNTSLLTYLLVRERELGLLDP